MGCDIVDHEMETVEEIPDLDLKISAKTKSEIKEKNFPGDSCEDSTEEESASKNTEELAWSAFEFCWQDFLPVSLSSSFLVTQTEIPSLLSLVSDVSDLLPDGALFFNFCFDWWFTEPLHPDEDSVVIVELKYPCTKCDKKFRFDWEVPKHYLEVHLASCTQEKPKELEIKPEPAPVAREPTPEIYVDPYPPLEDWRWEDFLPDWDKPFLPYSEFIDFQSSDIEDDCPTPPPSPSPTPPPAPAPPVRREVTPAPAPAPAPAPVLKCRARPDPPAPVIKQSKFLCRTCDKLICNSCFSSKCGAHNVEVLSSYPGPD